MLVAHFAVPLAGGGAGRHQHPAAPREEVRYICDHSGAAAAGGRRGAARGPSPRCTDELGTSGRSSRSATPTRRRRRCPASSATTSSSTAARDEPLPWTVDDEDATISINYTSGTTGQPQGRDVHPPRRLPERARRDHHTRARPRQRLPVDAADVPLQRLVHPVGGRRRSAGAHVCLRAVRGDAIWQLIDDERRHPPQRRADGADDARERPAGPPARPAAGHDHRRRPAEPDR